MLVSINTYINDRYGSRRGLLNHFLFGARTLVGTYRDLKRVDWARVDRLVFICHGNICRSPLASAYAFQKSGVESISFGLNCRGGAPADPRAVQFADKIGVELRQHQSRHIRTYEPRNTDLVIGMEPAHLAQLDVWNRGVAQETLLGLWSRTPTAYIHDPYMSGALHFERCEQSIIHAVDHLITKLSRGS